MSHSASRKGFQVRLRSVISVVGLALVSVCGLAWWLKPVDGRLPVDRYRAVLMVLWWVVVLLYTAVLCSLIVLGGWQGLRRLVGTVRVSSNRDNDGRRPSARFRPAAVVRRGLVRRLSLAIWFTSILVVVELELIGAALLFWNSRFNLEPLPQYLPVAEGQFVITAIGGSTTEGWPYHQWVSFPEIVHWRLEELFPDLEVRVDNLSYGGAYLENMYEDLRDLRTRPDVLIVYSGHNEFPNRFPAHREAGNPYYGFAHPSLLSRVIVNELERTGMAVASGSGQRHLFDRPVCTPGEEAMIYDRFRRTLEEIVRVCRRHDTLAILMIPASNESGYEPNRSVLPADLSPSKQTRLQGIFRQLSRGNLEPVERISLLNEARRLAPGFAETWYRLGQAYETTEQFDKARHCYQTAINTDGYPGRATCRIADIYRELAAKYDCVLLDAREVLSGLSHNGILGYEQFLDDVHPALPGYVALGNAVLFALEQRGKPQRAWPDSWHEATEGEVIHHFRIDRETWLAVCRHETWLHNELAALRFDPSTRLSMVQAYHRAGAAIRAGSSPEELGIPGFVLRNDLKPQKQQVRPTN